MISPKETNKPPITESKEMELYERSDKEFRIILLKKFSELQENRQLHETGGKIVNKMGSSTRK